MFFETVIYELNWKYWLAILEIEKPDRKSENFSGYIFSLIGITGERKKTSNMDTKIQV
jgi:hypothetical protein